MRTFTSIRNSRLHLRHVAIFLGASAFALTAAIGARSYLDLQNLAADQTVEFSASYKSLPDLKSLNHESDLVVVGHIVQGSTRLIPFQAATPGRNGAPAEPSVDTKKADALNKQPAPSAQAPAAGTPGNAATRGGAEGRRQTVNTNLGTPITVFDVKIDRVLRGSASQGADIQVTQPGGKVTLDTFPGGPRLNRSVVFEHDTLMNAGENHVMFLTRGPDGTYFVAGGPQGRMSVDNAGRVHPVDTAAPALKTRAGHSVEALAQEVAAESDR